MERSLLLAFLGVFSGPCGIHFLVGACARHLTYRPTNPRRGLIFVQSGVVVWVLVCSTDERQVRISVAAVLDGGECFPFVCCLCALYLFTEVVLRYYRWYVVPLG